MQSDRVAIGPEEMRSSVLEAVGTSGGQVEGLLYGVARVLANRGLLESSYADGHRKLPDAYWGGFRDAFAELTTQGIVAPGFNAANPWWPFFSLTAYGQRCFRENSILPYDVDAYIASLTQAAPLDGVELRFLPQALRCYYLNMPDASAVMLGCAAEHLVVLLGEALVRRDSASQAKTQKLLDTGPAKTLFDHVRKQLDKGTGAVTLSRGLEERRDTAFGAIAEMIRMTRNAAGHPMPGSGADRDRCFILLHLFPEYRLWVLQAAQEIRS